MQKAHKLLCIKRIFCSKYVALWGVCGGLVLIGVWVNIVGYSAAFLSPASTDADYETTRYLYHLGRIFASLSFIFFYRFYDDRSNIFFFVMPVLLCLGTIVFAMSHHQTLFLPLVVGSVGSFIMGFCYIWFVSTFYIFLARSFSMRLAIIITTVSQVLEQVIAVVLNFETAETMQIAICFILPFFSMLALGVAKKSKPPLPPSCALAGRAKTHQLVLLVASNIALVAIGAVSNIGIWGNVRIDFLTSSPEVTILETITACIAVLVLSLTTLSSSTKEPLSFRYQIPFLVLIAGFMLAIIQLLFFTETTIVSSIAIMSIEFYAHILVWSILMSAIKDLSIPAYKIVGIGMGVYSICSIGWIYLLENNTTIAGAVVLIISFFLIIVMAVHPRLLYKKDLPQTVVLEDINEYTIEGEPEIPLESNGAAIVANLKNRCELLAIKYRLSPREEEVLFLLAQGRTKPVIQDRLVLSEGTTKTHIAHIYEKMSVHSHQDLLDVVFDGRI